MYSCSIIIVAYNSCDFIPACLKSVRDACEGIDAQVIVLDNGSVEPILPEIRQFFPEVEWIDSKENLGFGKGCNLAEKRATKPYLFFINPDTVVSRDSFTKVLDFMEEHPESGTVGCRILNEDGSLQWACRRSFPTIVSAVSKTIGLAALFPKNKTLASYNMTYADPDEVTEVDAISGSFFCMRRDLYEKLGGFDEDFFMYGEDLDLCFRAKVAGCKNYYTPSTNILHFKGQSCRTRRWDSYLDFYKAMLIFVKKHKDLYFVPNFLVSFGIMFAAFVGMFSRLIPKFWKMFLDLGVIALWAFTFLNYESVVSDICFQDSCLESGCAGTNTIIKHPIMDLAQFEDWWLVGIVAVVNLVFLMFRGEYTESSLKGEKFLRYLVPLNLFAVGGYSAFRYFTQTPIIDDASTYLPYESHWITLVVCSSLFIPLALLAWRRIAFWINYFYRIFAKKRHRSILLGGREDSLNNWFDSYNVIPGIEILGCVSGEPEKLSEENRKHLLGPLSDMESICNRTGCRELLVVSNFSGYREDFDINWLDKLGLRVYLLIGNGKNGNFALVDLKYLH
ncbi:Glycosyltransferase, GT2 family [Fibrobacter sp. UWCM]|uniref:glycosyltransferase family 2 protein n=1 Tax=unclassified Fibrobacter TaxID=2634177 RepID=UPI0009180C66|nr:MULTISPECIES: glycosyltransferase family 2 protein [unclassified Fibrobacter]SHG68135.1 Glycosyltransferase, GT2 family [Fibrobacter sp. UWCM]SHM86713.1 Glycosyltransferase, GT2 family [Fibrobacter sp. UWR3]